MEEKRHPALTSGVTHVSYGMGSRLRQKLREPFLTTSRLECFRPADEDFQVVVTGVGLLLGEGEG